MLKIYSKTGIDYCNLFNYKIEKLPSIVDETLPIIFLHSKYDEINSNISFLKWLDECHWQNLLNNPNSLLVYENISETFDVYKLSTQIKEIIDKRHIPINKIYLILVDEIHVEALLKELSLENINGINVDFYNKWLMEIPPPIKHLPNISKKFSTFSRRFNQERLKLFFELIKEDLLTEFEYSFHNINPYQHKIILQSDILSFITNDYSECKNKIENWVMGIPYTSNNGTDYTKIYTESLNHTIISTDIHLIIETNFNNIQSHPIAWITEKTYRSIICSKPFLMYSTPHSLDYIKKLGFKTFNPYIDESYDSIIDEKERRRCIVKEIKRIKNLNNADYNELLNNCKSNVEYNFKLLLEKKQKILNNIKQNGKAFKISLRPISEETKLERDHIKLKINNLI